MPFVYQFVNIKRDVVTLAESINQGLVFVDRVLVVELAAIPSPPGDCARPGGLRIPALLAGGALAEMNRCAGSTPFFLCLPARLQASLLRSGTNTKKPEDFHLPVLFCGEGGI